MEVAVNPVTNKTYVSNYDSYNVTVLDGKTNATTTVAVGGSPGPVAVNPVTNKIYVGNRGSSSVTVIDGATNTTTTVATGSCPMAIAVNSVTNKIYVANYYSANVTVIDGVTNATSTVSVGTSPQAIALNPVTNKIYVANKDSASVTVIDGATNATETVTADSGPGSIAVNPITNKIYVSNYWGNTVTVIDGATNSTTTIAAGINPSGIAVNPVTNKIYLINWGDNNVAVIDGATDAIIILVAADLQPQAISVNPVTNRIYVANRSNDVTVIDGATNVATNFSAGTYPVALSVNPITNKIYVVNNWSKDVTVIDGAQYATTAIIGSGSYSNSVAVNAMTNRMYVANYLADTVTMIDGETNTTTTITPGRFPIDVAVNPITNKIYASNNYSNTVTVIDGLTNATITVPVGAGPYGIRVNPVTNKIYVSDNGTNTVTVIDGATNATSTVVVGQFPTALAVNTATNKIYVVSHASNNLTVIDGDTNATTIVTVGSSPGSVAVNEVTNKIYVTNYDSNNVTVIDGSTNSTLTIPAGSLPHDVAVNPLTNRIYITNHGSSSVTVIDGTTNSTATVATGAFPEDVTVNPVTNKIYAVNNGSASVTVIDGVTNATATVPVGDSPMALTVNPSTNKIYVAHYMSANAVMAISEQSVQPIPLMVNITPLEGNFAIVSNPTLTFTITNSYAPLAPTAQNIYYQVDTWTGPWQQALVADNGGSFTIPSQTVGFHTVYAFAGYGQEATSMNRASLIPGSMTAYTLMTPKTAPCAPTDIMATEGYSEATITFTAPANYGGSAITGYTVMSNPPGGQDSNAGSLLTTHIVTGLNNGTTYTFTVTATNAVGTGPESEASNSVTPWGTTPDPFSFVDQGNVLLSTLVTSNTITITGITAGVPISIIGGQYEINCNGLWKSATGILNNYSSVRVRLMSSPIYSTTTNAALTIGGISDTFSVTTRPPDTTPDPFIFTDQTNVTANTLITSNSITVTGIETSAPVTITGGEYQINGSGIWTSASGTVVNGNTVRVRQTSSSSYGTTTDTVLTIGGVSDTFNVTTLPPDTTPDPFAFTAQTKVAINEVITSNSITVTGINMPALVTISGGEYEINNSGTWLSTGGTVVNGNTVRVRQMSASTYGIRTDTILTIGSVSAMFSIVTSPAIGVALTTNIANPQPASTLVAFIATSSGGTGHYEYKFRLRITGVWTTVQDYSTSNTWCWDTTGYQSGEYMVSVQVRNEGDTIAYAAEESITYSLYNVGDIYTMAGGVGDGGLAVSARLSNPSGAAKDAFGNVYIADSVGRRIRKVNAVTGVISTIAGNGSAGYSGDNGPATSASLSYPVGVALDRENNIFIVDGNNNCVRKVDATTGVITTVVGNGTAGYSGDNGPATLAQLNGPGGVAIDSTGNIFIADTSNHRIRKVDVLTGVITTVAGNGDNGYGVDPRDSGPATSARLSYPQGVAADPSGNIYIADSNNNRIRKIDAATGVMTTVAGNGTFGYSGDNGAAVLAALYSPSGITVDSGGDIYIADSFNNRIRKVTASTGIITTIAGAGISGYTGDNGPATSASLAYPRGVVEDAEGNILIVDTNNSRIRRIDATTGVISTIAGVSVGSYGGAYAGDDGPAAFALFSGPESVAVDTVGNIIIADTTNHRIRKVDALTGVITTVAGNGTSGLSGDNGPASAASLSAPRGVAVDGAGNIYIADTNNSRIRRVDAITGVITTVAGSGSGGYGGDNGPATKAWISIPFGVALDSFGNVYIADTYNSRIRKVNAITGVITTVAGSYGYGYVGDNGPAITASLAMPSGVTVDASGNIYIADTNNSRIRKVDAITGVITSVAGNGTNGYSGDNGAATSAAMYNPSGVSITIGGDLYIADTNNHRIRKVDASNGLITTIAGNGVNGSAGDYNPATEANMSFPASVAFDSAGNVYIADMSNNRIRKIVAYDATPDAFSFIAQTGIAVNTQVVSNAITVTGLNSPAAISIAGGEYEVNGSGLWLNTPSTVNNGETVRVRVISSPNYSITTSSTLTIGTVSHTFSVETIGQPVWPPNAPMVSSMRLTKNTHPTWTWSSGGNDGNGTYRFRLDGSDLTTEATITLSLSYTPASALSESAHTLFVQEQNNADNWSDSGSFTVTIDASPPSLGLFTLADGSYTNNAILNVSGTIMDANGIQSLVISNQTVTFGTLDNVNYTFSYPVTLVTGSNLITTAVTDMAGNMATDTRTIVLDTTYPVLTLTGPADNSVVSRPTVTVTGTTDKPTTVLISLNSGPTLTAAFQATSFSMPVSLLTNTVNTINVYAIDLAGNTTAAKRTLTNDETNPTIAVAIPNQDMGTNQNSIMLGGTVSDLTDISMLASCPTASSGLVSAPTTTTWSVNISNLQPGVNSITIKATDRAGNSTSVIRNIIYTVTPVTVNPVTTPTNQNSQTISGTMEQNATVAVVCSTAVVGTVTYPSSTTWRTDITLMTQGTNTITIVATDAIGNAANPLNIAIVFDPYAAISGDLNGDSVVDITDALLALRIAAGLDIPTASELAHGDVAPLVNGLPQPDGRIDVSDVVVLLRKSAGLLEW